MITKTTQRRWTLALAVLGFSILAACGGGGSDGGSPSATGTAVAGSTATAVVAQPTNSAGQTAPATLSLTARGSSARTASLSWMSAAGATGYTIERKAPGSSWTTIATPDSADNSFVDDGLTSATTYTYRLSAQGVNAVPAEQTAVTTANAPLITEAATTLAGAADTRELAAAGGSVVSADGAVRLTFPPGSLTKATTVTLQAANNPLPEGQGTGVRIQVQGIPSQPLTLTLRYPSAMDTYADGQAVAVQRADGSWLSLPVTSIDKTERTVSVAITPSLVSRQSAIGSDRAAGTQTPKAPAGLDFHVARFLNFYLSPREASVETGGSLTLVPYAHTEGLPCWEDPDVGCLPELVVERREIPFQNQKTGYSRKWFVFADEGGTPALGTITPRANIGAVYQAPSRTPTPNPVVVSFESRHLKTGRTVTLASRVQINEPVWTMIMSGTLEQANDIGFSYSAEAIWTRDSADGNVYRANGTQSVHVINIVCTVSASPGTVPLPPGALTIDRSTQPARYRLDVGSVWQTLLSGTCPDGTGSVSARVPGQLVVEGTLSADGKRIDGTTSQNHITWRWSLTNQL